LPAILFIPGWSNVKLYEWEIWHTYSTYMESSSVDLLNSAERLVDAGLAEFAILHSGESFWPTPVGLGKGVSSVEVDLVDGAYSYQLRLDKATTCKPEDFPLEAFGQAIQFLAGEQLVLGPEPSLSPPYLRAFLGKVSLISNPDSKDTRHVLNLYPILLMYATGVLVLELRMIGPDHPTELPEFITSGVNLFRYHFDGVEVSPGLSREATRAYYRSGRRWAIWLRPFLLHFQREHNLAVSQQTSEHEDGPFSFRMAPLGSTEPQRLQDIALTIFHVAAFLSERPRDGWRYFLSGQNPVPALGDFWSGRPHVHLVRFDGQAETAAENEKRNYMDFASILCRVPQQEGSSRTISLPPTLRLFDDYGAYVTSATSLWVWSQQGLERERSRMDPNRGNLIYERQLIIEVLEYGYMLHRSLYHRMEMLGGSKEIAAVRFQVLDLKRRMREASHAGEIRGLLNAGWKEMSLPELRQEIEEGLSLRELDRQAAETLRTTRIGWALTTVFGFVAVPALAEQLISTLWKISGIPAPANTELQTLLSVAVAFLVVAAVVVPSAFMSGRKTR
jgi:hypothetical protein